MSFGDLVAMIMPVMVVVTRGVMWQTLGGSLVPGRKTGFCFKLLDTSSMHGS
jgi:hypothetical protein